MPEAFAISRQRDLTPQVPAGAIAVAIRQVVLFANPSPTGWRQLGLTAFRCFRAEADAPFALSPGDEVLLERVGEDALERLRRDDPGEGGARAEPLP